MAGHYTAVAKQNSGRMAWLVEFRHPLKPDSNNRPGRKTRKGLGTSDQTDASKLVAQLNLLLADESLWSPAARAQALVKFDPRVVEIFLSEIEARSTSPGQLRDIESDHDLSSGGRYILRRLPRGRYVHVGT